MTPFLTPAQGTLLLRYDISLLTTGHETEMVAEASHLREKMASRDCLLKADRCSQLRAQRNQPDERDFLFPSVTGMTGQKLLLSPLLQSKLGTWGSESGKPTTKYLTG